LARLPGLKGGLAWWLLRQNRSSELVFYYSFPI
jgi:hypothetical protein